MKICLISVEIFAWGKYGGFGRAARIIGHEMVKRGHTVFAVVPRRAGQRPVETLDGMTVFGFQVSRPWTAAQLLKQCDADLYHSCEPSLSTALAMRTMPDRAHLVTVRDPRGFADWATEFLLPSLNKWQVLFNFFYEHNWVVHRAVQRADGVFAPARSLVQKIHALYGLRQAPKFLPTPVGLPRQIRKAGRPTVCYLARLDRRKRPTLFLDLARQFPHVQFIAVGASRDPQWDAKLRARYADVPNLEMTGFIDQFTSSRHSTILEQSWVFVNTAAREGLPNAFLEAAAHRCAILAEVDPDGFASQFGYCVRDGDFANGLRWLLEQERWKAFGERGHRHVLETFATERAIDQHVAAYELALAHASGRSLPGAGRVQLAASANPLGGQR